MSESKPFYITTTLPYVNAEPHIGFALEIIQADVLARYFREKLGAENVFFSTGSDEHGQKIFEAAQKEGKDTQEYVDFYAGKFEELKKALNLSYDTFVRTTDEHHVVAAQEMWRRCEQSGDIYEKEFEGLYCVGCERYLTERDLVEGKCAIHLTAPQLLKEKNWFFRFSKYQDKILDYLGNPQSILPDWRREEAINFVKEGLEDFSISREKARLAWGIPVPGDDTQVMYVWFDALTNYISTLGWPEGGNFEKFWHEGHTLQLAGKDQVRFQSLMWQAMLFSAGIKNTDQVFYHGFINSGGQKMSKSLGNVVKPFEIVEKYGTDALRYFLCREISTFEDTDFTLKRMQEAYNGNLANGLGNLTSRIMKLAETILPSPVSVKHSVLDNSYLEKFEIQKAINQIWEKIGELDREIQEKKPWESKDHGVISGLVEKLSHIAISLTPFMPETSAKIIQAIADNKLSTSLFPRIEATS